MNERRKSDTRPLFRRSRTQFFIIRQKRESEGDRQADGKKRGRIERERIGEKGRSASPHHASCAIEERIERCCERLYVRFLFLSLESHSSWKKNMRKRRGASVFFHFFSLFFAGHNDLSILVFFSLHRQNRGS